MNLRYLRWFVGLRYEPIVMDDIDIESKPGEDWMRRRLPVHEERTRLDLVSRVERKAATAR